MNVTRSVAVQATVDVLPTPQSPKADPLATARPQSPSRERDSEVLRRAYQALAVAPPGDFTRAKPAGAAEPRSSSACSSTVSRPRWLRKVTAWLEGRWGLGHKRKPS